MYMRSGEKIAGALHDGAGGSLWDPSESETSG